MQCSNDSLLSKQSDFQCFKLSDAAVTKSNALGCVETSSPCRMHPSPKQILKHQGKPHIATARHSLLNPVVSKNAQSKLHHASNTVDGITRFLRRKHSIIGGPTCNEICSILKDAVGENITCDKRQLKRHANSLEFGVTEEENTILEVNEETNQFLNQTPTPLSTAKPTVVLGVEEIDIGSSQKTLISPFQRQRDPSESTASLFEPQITPIHCNDASKNNGDIQLAPITESTFLEPALSPYQPAHDCDLQPESDAVTIDTVLLSNCSFTRDDFVRTRDDSVCTKDDFVCTNEDASVLVRVEPQTFPSSPQAIFGESLMFLPSNSAPLSPSSPIFSDCKVEVAPDPKPTANPDMPATGDKRMEVLAVMSSSTNLIGVHSNVLNVKVS